MPKRPQTHANHLRFLPAWHFFAFPVLVVHVGVSAWSLIAAPSAMSAWLLVVALALAAAVFLGRLGSLKNQDRIIRLEERLRLALLLDDELRPSIPQIRTRQLIALRFAADEELPELARRCVAGELTSPKAIKQAIRSWRADHHRV